MICRLTGRLGSWREGDEETRGRRRPRPQDSDGEDNQDLETNAGKVCRLLRGISCCHGIAPRLSPLAIPAVFGNCGPHPTSSSC